MTPLGLLIGFVCLMKIFTGKRSPGSTPARRTFVVAVISSPAQGVVPLHISSSRGAVHLAEFGSLTTRKLCVLLLMQLELLLSLGTGLKGGPESEDCGPSDEVLPGISLDVDLIFDLDFALFETGCREITRGFGTSRFATSMDSSSKTCLSQLMVGEMVVGRVRVAVIT